MGDGDEFGHENERQRAVTFHDARLLGELKMVSELLPHLAIEGLATVVDWLADPVLQETCTRGDVWGEGFLKAYDCLVDRLAIRVADSVTGPAQLD